MPKGGIAMELWFPASAIRITAPITFSSSSLLSGFWRRSKKKKKKSVSLIRAPLEATIF